MSRVRSWAALGLALGLPAAIILIGGGKATGHEPIRFGRDSCDRCHMLIGRGGFAGERRAKDGSLHKYDDVGCLLLALWGAHEETTQAWVEDHAGSGFVPLIEATLVRTNGEPTPMGYGVVAFRDRQAAASFASLHGGAVMSLEELFRAGPRFFQLPADPHAEEVHR